MDFYINNMLNEIKVEEKRLQKTIEKLSALNNEKLIMSALVELLYNCTNRSREIIACETALKKRIHV